MGDRPLEGLRVLELAIAIAGPHCTRNLAHFGADVVKMESTVSLDVVRLVGSAWARDRLAEIGAAYYDTGPYVSEMNSGKKSVGLNLKHPDGVEAARRLLAQSDVFVTNYSTPAVRALGLSYEDAKTLRPDVIYLALPGFGSDPATPYYDYIAWGPNQAPLVGLDNLTGYPDQDPAGIATIAPPDYCSALHGLIAVLAALEHRDKTGEGTYIDLSQYEATVALLGPFLLQTSLTGELQPRVGNRSAEFAPQGVYPCRGVSRWVAISVGGDAEWAALGRVAGDPIWAGDERFATEALRRAAHDEIDELLAAWTSLYSPAEVAAWLQSAGVAAYPAQDNEDVILDPQIRDRGWYQVKASSRFGRDLSSGYSIHLTDTPGETATAGPILAEHTTEVLTDIGGYAEKEVAALIVSGAAETPHNPDAPLRRPYDDYLYVLVAGTDTERKQQR